MNASLKWLNTYVEISGNVDDMAEILTDDGIPVEHVHRPGEEMSGVVTGRLLSVEKHPDATHLVICQVDIGEKQLQIVTGASNVRLGQIVPVATPNSHLPGGIKIKSSKLRGVRSEGMLCSAQELGLDIDLFPGVEKHGIMILPETTPVGIDMHKLYDLDDTIYEFELTPNRADCFSMIGLALEFSALFGGKLTLPQVHAEEDGPSIEGRVHVRVEAEDMCDRFCARLLEQVKIAPSPEWIAARLRSAGIRPINNVVDAANYVMLEYGQPMHTYDYDKVADHTLICRHAAEGETITTLDGEERALQAADLVIADTKGLIGIAGVMGGLESEVTDRTKSVLLEAAVFNGASIRRTSRRLGLRSEASGRYERGVNPVKTAEALDRICQLLQEQNACTVAKGVIDVYPHPHEEKTVALTVADINAYIGTELPQETMTDILTRLHFAVTVKDGGSLSIKVPAFRPDVEGKADICEEIARVYGYANVPATTPMSAITKGTMSRETEAIMKISDRLIAAGMSEAITFSFMHTDSLKKLNYPETDEVYRAIPIINPISEEYPDMRTTLLPGLMQALKYNLSQKNKQTVLFESGTVFHPKELPITELPVEEKHIAGILTGGTEEKGYPNDPRPYDFFDIKGIMEDAMQAAGIGEYQIQRGSCPVFHPGKCAEFVKDGKVLAEFGELHPSVIDNYGLKTDVFAFVIYMPAVIEFYTKEIRSRKLPKYPAVERDLAFLVPNSVTNEEMQNVICRGGGSHLCGLYLFDLYQGSQVPKGYKSMAYSLQFRDESRTLTDEETDQWIRGIIAKAEGKGCKLRE